MYSNFRSAIAVPIIDYLLKHFREVPERLGSVDDVHLVNEGGVLFAKVGDQLREVVVATHKDVQSWSGVLDGVYAINTGSTGLAETFSVLGVGYMLVMALSALVYRFPAPGYAQYLAHKLPPASRAASHHHQHFDVDAKVSISVPQVCFAHSGAIVDDDDDDRNRTSSSIHSNSSIWLTPVSAFRSAARMAYCRLVYI
jgi:hypothetical protein